MVEDVKGLRTELKSHAFRDLEMFEQRHVKVGPVGVVQAVAPGISKRQALWQGISVQVVNLGPQAVGILHNSCIGIANFVSTCSRADSVGNASVVCRDDHAKRGSGLEAGDAGELPSAENLIRKTWALEERQIPNVGEVQDVPLVEVGAGAVCAGVIRINEASVKTIRRIVDGMAPGVSEAKL